MEPDLPVIIDGSVAHLPSTDFRNATASADGYARAEKSLRTRQAYEGQLRHFAAWCAEARAPFMPSNAETVAAMPVLLTTEEEYEVWLRAPWSETTALQRLLPDEAMRIVASGLREDRHGREVPDAQAPRQLGLL